MVFKATSRIARWGKLLLLPRFRSNHSHLPDRKKRPVIVYGLYATCLLLFSGIENVYAIQLSSDSQQATAGYYQLSWAGDIDQFQLQESKVAGFQTFSIIYNGKDLARVVSGKSDGDYYYRVIDPDNSTLVSNVVKVTVAHHPLENAILFFLAGAIVFVATLVLIMKGSRKAGR